MKKYLVLSFDDGPKEDIKFVELLNKYNLPATLNLNSGLENFVWYYDRRPLRDSVFDRSIRATQRDDVAQKEKPRFRITERIDYDRRRLVENRMWEDRIDQLTPDVIEWRNTRATYPNK